MFAASLSMTAVAQQVYEKGKPNVDNYLQKGLFYKLVNANFTETVAGNAMKMASCVNGKKIFK